MAKTIITILLLICCLPAIAFAAPDPSEVEEIKQAASAHVIGEVIKDELVEQPEDESFPHQERKMTLQITEVLKSATGIQNNTAIEVHYTYIPSWIVMEGGARMDIAVSDKIEIWLDSEEIGWKPALSGNTVVHLQKSENRPEHIKAPPLSKLQLIKDRLSEIPLAFYVFIPLFIFLGIVAFISNKVSAHQQAKPSSFPSNKSE